MNSGLAGNPEVVSDHSWTDYRGIDPWVENVGLARLSPVDEIRVSEHLPNRLGQQVRVFRRDDPSIDPILDPSSRIGGV